MPPNTQPSTPNTTPPSPGDAPPREQWGWTCRQRLGLGILSGLLIAVLVIQYIRRPLRLGEPATLIDGTAATLPQRMNPNTATQQELARIPHIGDALAAKIVAYRETRKGVAQDGIVFRRVADLDAVPGVGKKLMEQLEPFLEFPDEGIPK